MPEYFIGIMSGTSVDGIDGVLAAVDDCSIEVLGHVSLPIPESDHTEALALAGQTTDSLNRAFRLANHLSKHYAACAGELLGAFDAPVTAIGCHGQTLRHFPDDPCPISIQMVNGAALALATGIPTITDFRSADLALGGQGAPLAPSFHNAVFRSSQCNRVILNLGGIANITCLPAAAEESVTGFDTGPANALMDLNAQQHLGQRHDDQGHWGQSGSLNDALLEKLRSDGYFALPAPKSTGREYFSGAWLERKLQGFEGISPADLQRTLVELTATTIADAVNRLGVKADELFVCGGGCHNRFLMERIDANLPGITVDITESIGLPPMQVEACTFAWLAYRRIKGLPGNLPSVTGASREAVLGALYLP